MTCRKHPISTMRQIRLGEGSSSRHCGFTARTLVAEFAEVPVPAVAGINPLDSDAVAAALKSDVSLTVRILITTLCAYGSNDLRGQANLRISRKSPANGTAVQHGMLLLKQKAPPSGFSSFVLVFPAGRFIYFGALFVAGRLFLPLSAPRRRVAAEAIDQIMPAMLSVDGVHRRRPSLPVLWLSPVSSWLQAPHAPIKSASSAACRGSRKYFRQTRERAASRWNRLGT